ncbi:CONSTANS-like 2 [Perilla frutescens var. hirtella]|uniref:CONSTANS-like 2 n=1 Tax=Perilla frutescens var. hirtella TaxID=608512 RepID=A0AAD4P5C5_PERFH|nr:CONSTANS-like 2 [Perilla frutescens var. hirtella]
MLKLETPTTNGGAAARNTWGRTCDTCRSAASSVYCRADLAYLCTACDARVHSAASPLHERVWVCESCERAPAAFLCKADSASLCAACDAEIHSANPLARRHHRVPIQPIPASPYGPLVANPGGLSAADDDFLTRDGDDHDVVDGEDEDEAASWLLLNPIKNGDDEARPALFAGEVDEYLDLDDYNQFNEGYNHHQQHHYGVPQSSYCGDSIVPIQYQKGKNQCFQLGLEVGYSYPPSMSQSISISSMEVGVVPESAASEVSITHTRPPKGTIDLFSSAPIQIPTQLTPMDREARVLRYREKKKTRKFEKTIRYASRKAYAETRPRIKGRFAKRRGAEVEVDQMFSSQSLMAENAYGVVPSF